MRYLVTGGAGFVGSHLADALLARGNEVVCVDNFNDYYSPARKRRNVERALAQPGYTLVEADLRDDAAIDAAFETYRPDKVAHLAAMGSISYSVRHPKLYEEVNIRGTLNVLDAARRYQSRGVVLASTSSIYGRTDKIPFVETDSTDRPLAPYPASKKADEVIAAAYHTSYGLPCTCVRFFNVYGPRGRPDMTPYMFTDAIAHGRPITLYDGGRPRRDWTYVDDIIAGVVAALEADLSYEIFNLGRGQPVVMSDFVTIIERLVGKPAQIVDAPLPANEALVTYADVGKAHKLLGYNPRVSIEDGLQRFWAWYQAEVLGR
ncbi:MAG TPA: GDP-mannose 4,6-dehydratase [Roseiflexaceae bacterium]|nr:GDP-mannose 4,6-dehydratase [Roseiflexaceae bacterium]